MRMLALLVVGLTAVAGCGGDSGIAPTAPIPTKETFTGTLPPLEVRLHNFTVGRSGTVNVTLTSASPPDGVAIGLGIGVPQADGSCPLLDAVAATAGPQPQLSGRATPGALCLAVFDPDLLAADVVYEVVVSHP